ncbi:tRNA guanosine(34) transglycosylase Tgt [Candidatus Gracilibacteria bacterium]|nr:tRNA guanosine(34) transglycosylase Tgt [Candidatus Gracilibacteria bacterium]
MDENFVLEKTCGLARAGILKTRRGEVKTPFFLSVATRGAIKAGVSADDLMKMQAPVVLANTYHLHLRPTSECIAKLGGLHEYIKWDGPILTDSGGFQVFSLKRKKILDHGVEFRSHIDGELIFLDAKKSIEIQHNLGSDIIMAFDECPPNVPKYHKIRQAVERTTQWAKESIDAHFAKYSSKLSLLKRPQIFGIVQGGSFSDLRQKSLEEITALPFDGFALGGLAVGETTAEMYRVLDEMVSQMPEQKPRYLMGVGTPENLLEAIDRGVDMFDCVMPMRNARHGTIFTWDGILKIENSCYQEDSSVLDKHCDCEVCHSKKYSRSYLRHLLLMKEALGMRLLTIHNLSFYHQLMRTSREKILTGEFKKWKKTMIKQFNSRNTK